MSSMQPKGLRLLALIADVLPFEVPIIFTNDFFFASTLPLSASSETKLVLARLRAAKGFTIPYNYNIIKDRGRTTTLSIIHPIMQLKWAEFVDQYAETILSYCSKGDMSLRHPFAVVSQHASAPLEPEATARDGLPHELLDGSSPDFSRLSSYFRLRRFNILAKFMESDELVSLEKRFSHMLSLDISKCFYNIYTHSIAWAVKGKAFAKKQIGTYTFESRFDELMQDANYKETNGIVVGPEISRVFAEIIFQQIDKALTAKLSKDKVAPHLFTIRRYVDDYFVFANSQDVAELVEKELSSLLSEYKLYLNTDKRALHHRPFVSAISKLKREITGILDDVGNSVKIASKTPGFCEHRSLAAGIKKKLIDLRLAVAPEEVGFHNISGWLMWKLRSITATALAFLKLASGTEATDCAAQILASVMQLAFYVTALDFRVRTGFNIALIISSVLPSLAADDSEQSEWLQNLIFEELIELLEIVASSRDILSVEVCNLLLIGSHCFRERFVQTKIASNVLRRLLEADIGYRSYITAKFCF